MYINCLVVGSHGCGKTSFISRARLGSYATTSPRRSRLVFPMAHGYEFRVHVTESLELSGELDPRDNEYDFVFVCFENGNNGSFMYARYMAKQLMKKYKIPFLLIQTKTDVVNNGSNIDSIVKKFCHRYGIGLVHLSSKIGYGIDQPWLFCFSLLTGNQNIDLLRLSLADDVGDNSTKVISMTT